MGVTGQEMVRLDAPVSVVRAESAADWAAARRLIGEYYGWMESAYGTSPAQIQAGAQEELDKLEDVYDGAQGALFIGIVGGKPAGAVAFLLLQDDLAEMKRLFLTPDARGGGSGRCSFVWQWMRRDSSGRRGCAPKRTGR